MQNEMCCKKKEQEAIWHKENPQYSEGAQYFSEIKPSSLSFAVNTDLFSGLLVFSAVQPFRQQLLQLLHFEVGLLVELAEEEDDLHPLHQLLQTLVCTRASCQRQVLCSQ